MAAQSDMHPVYSGNALSWQERRKLGRKFGKYDFDQFQHLQGSGYFLGKGTIGEMEVACKFLFRKSRWGVFTHAKNPGGILYLDLVFTEPAGCNLQGATIISTLDENDKDLQGYFPAESEATNKVPVHITQHGPQNLVGQSNTAKRSTTRNFIPTFNAGGSAELGGMGWKSKKRMVEESQWRFSSQTMPDSTGRPTILRWDLSESDLDRQPKHTNTFHTAFAFEHDGQPFFMRVEVFGILVNTASQLLYKTKTKFKKLKFSPQTTTTLVNFGGRRNPYTQSLDELAKKIASDMVQENMTPANQVQTSHVLHTQSRQSDTLDEMSVEEEDTSSFEAPSSQATTKASKEYDTAELKENTLALMAFRRAGTTGIAPSGTSKPLPQNNTNVHNERQPEALGTLWSSPSNAHESTTTSPQTIIRSQHETKEPGSIQDAAPAKPQRRVIERTRGLLRELGLLPALVQLVAFLILLSMREKSPTRSYGNSPQENAV
ncbi:hypothetical protein HD806DRAFT_516883 [Xylariaceae sp. AK1471]|nr:hypothetical protein HD806DRAFT_516883 [Xylariaceae sp. AK1471]